METDSRKTLYGISPTSEKKFSMGDIEHMLDKIWNEHYNEVEKKYIRCDGCKYLVLEDGQWCCMDYGDTPILDVSDCLVELF